MARVVQLLVRNYRSIGEEIAIDFPDAAPVVLLGENNTGKSNIVRALDLVLGHMWPGTHEPDDNDFHGRDRAVPIDVRVRFDPADAYGATFSEVRWQYDSANAEPVYFRALPGIRGHVDSFVSNDVRSSCMCAVIEAERNLNYHLSYASKYTLLSRLMHRFHKALTEDEDTRNELLRLFGEVRTRFNEIQPFVDFTEMLRQQLGEFTQGMTHRLEVDFEAYNPVNFFHALRLHAQEDGERRTLAEMGTGEQQILALSFAYAYASAFHDGVLLVIEEPESHLHPLAQQWLAGRLATMCRQGLQILLTTHSSHFLDMLNLPGFALVKKTHGITSVTQLTVEALVDHCRQSGAPAERTTAENILQFYRSSATPELLEGLFARCVVLVEGRTEAMSLPILLARAGLETARSGIAVLPVGGKGSLAKWYRLFTAFAVPCYVVFDNDAPDDPAGVKRRDALRAIGIPPDDDDGLLSTDDWLVRPSHAVFGIDYENALRAQFPDYAAQEQAAREQGVDAKPFVARWVAEHLEFDPNVEGWTRVERLVGYLRALVPPQ